MKNWILAAWLLTTVYTSPCIAGAGAMIEPLPWPEATACTNCLSIQIDELSIRFPADRIARMNTFASPPGIHLSLKATQDGPEHLISMSASTSAQALEQAQRAGFPRAQDTQDFDSLLVKIGDLDPDSAESRRLRKLFGLDQSAKITRSERNDIVAYGFWRNPTELEKIAVILKGCDSVGCDNIYELYGPIPKAMFMDILRQMDRTPPP